jgi:serine/threonine protein kinase
LVDDLEGTQNAELHDFFDATTLTQRSLSRASVLAADSGVGLHERITDAVSVQEEIRIGSEFVGYRIDELIGRGGMGVVYRAYDLRLKRTVALKLMAPELALDRGFRERFSREAELAMSLEHPNVVPIHDAGDIDGRLYLAMRFVEGADLRALLRAEGALDKARSLAICSRVANALDAAHANGLVHRDVKPSNVLLGAGEHVYLADFGLTRRLEDSGSAGEHRSVGTPAYLAPEQIEGGSVDGRTDVYALGCLLFECLTGETPFPRGSRLALAWAHLEEEPPRATERRPELPEAIDAVIRKAMAKDPADRYPTCAALIDAAEAGLELRPPALLRHRRVVLAAVATLLAVVAALLAVLLTRGSDNASVVAPTVRANSLVRINPRTNKVDAVIGVGLVPSATAVARRSVWVYNRNDPSVSEIDPATESVRHTTKLAASPRPDSSFEGPVLAADSAGAWIIGSDQRGRSYLTRVFSGPRGEREYRLEQEPRAVAVGYDAVWVATDGARNNEVLRIDPTTGRVTKRVQFPRSAPVDSLTAGLGSVWVVSSSRRVLYRIDPRTGRVTGRTTFGGRVARPEVVFGSIWVGTTESAGDTVIVDPRTVRFTSDLGCCDPTRGRDAIGYGSIWTFDSPTGSVERWSGATHQGVVNIHVTSPPYYDGLCLTSIAAGAGAVWATVTANDTYSC